MTALGLALMVGLWRALGAPRRRGRRYFGRQLARVRSDHPGHTRRMVHHVEGLADGEVQMLVGRLRLAGAACASYDQGARVAASTIECPLAEPDRLRHGLPSVALRRRAGKLALELDGGPAAMITLEGDLEVLVGSQQAHPRRRLHGLPRLLCERVYRDRPARIEAGALLHEPPVVRNLYGGETVLVIGRVVGDGAAGPAPDDGAGQPYRASAPQRWLVRPAPSGDQAPIAALFAGAPAIPISPWARFGLWPMAWVAGATAALALTGALSLRLAWQNDLVAMSDASADAGAGADTRALALRRDRLPVDAPALAVAAATPFHRADALALLARGLAGSQQRGRDVVETRVAVARLQGHCAAAADVLRQHRQPRRAIVAAEQCVSDGREVAQARHVMGLAWMDLGEFESASEAFASIRDAERDRGSGAGPHDLDDMSEFDAKSEHAVAHVLAGAWTEAATTLRGLAARGKPSGSRVSFTCLAEAAAARGGSSDARGVLENLARSSRAPACALLAADLTRGEARRAWLGAGRTDQDGPGVAWHVHAADAGGKQMLYLRALLLRELDDVDVPGTERAGSADTLRLLAAGVPDGDTPYEAMPALERVVLERMYEHDAHTGDQAQARRERVLRMAITARAAGMAAHLGRHDRAAVLRDQLMIDAGALAALDASGDNDAWRGLRGDALLLAAVTHWRAGDLDAATEALEQARTLAPAALLQRVESVLGFEARGELHASLASVLTGGPARHGAHDAPGAPDATDAPDAGEHEVLALARAGDGAALARLVGAGRMRPNAVGVLAPALTTGHDAMLELLHWGRHHGAASVAEALWHDGARAFAAERLGDHALAEQVRAAAHRRYQALAQRESAVLVYLIEHL